jgi:amino acid transporter
VSSLGLPWDPPRVAFVVWVVLLVSLTTFLNVRGIKWTAFANEVLTAVMFLVIAIFLVDAVRYLWLKQGLAGLLSTQPFYNPQTFNLRAVGTATSLAALTYIGFDGISTLSEEAENPRRNILLATVLVCLITGVLSGLQVYGAQLIWGSKPFPSDQVESAFPMVARQAGGVILFHIINFTLLVANMGSGMGAQLAAGRLLYGMGRGNALPKSFFGAIEPKKRIPRNNIIAVGIFALIGAALLEFFANRLGGGAYEIGAQALNFGAFIAFMGVNAASFTRYFVKGQKTIGNFLPPVLGFLICFYIWLNLSRPAQIVGACWMAAGILYGAIKTRGFKGELVNFDMPPEE